MPDVEQPAAGPRIAGHIALAGSFSHTVKGRTLCACSSTRLRDRVLAVSDGALDCVCSALFHTGEWTRATDRSRAMKRIPKCRKCSQSIFAHLWLGRTRICIAPIPDGEAPTSWTGQLFLSLQKRKEERWLKRRG